METIKIIDTNANDIQQYGMCGYKNIKNEGYRRKVEWLKQRFAEGMKHKILYAEKDGAVGGIEYIPGEYAWRPVDAAGYLFIHCIYIMSRKYKDKGWGVRLLETCLEDAANENKHGAAVVTRKGTFMAGGDLFQKSGFEVSDTAPPDFELLVKKLDPQAPSPVFKDHGTLKPAGDDEGLVIYTSDQCPYAEKSVREISEVAGTTYGIKPKIVLLNTFEDAQNSPCAFGTFCIVYRGAVVADHPISSRRFTNIMNKILK